MTNVSQPDLKGWLCCSAGLVGILLFASAGQAIPVQGAIEPYSSDTVRDTSPAVAPDDALAQITSVSQLADVQPTDWAFQALQSLVERYGCIAGYPDDTYRGDRPLSRDEFAAGVNACLDRINELIATGSTDLVQAEDLTTLQRMQTEFASELAVLRGQVDQLETRTATIAQQRFSPTSRLNILSSFNISQAFASGDVQAEGVPIPGSQPAARLAVRAPNPITGELEPVVTAIDRDPETTFSHSTYFTLSSSFTGRDLLTTIVAVGNGNPPASTFSSAGFASTFGVPYADSNPVNPVAPNQVGLLELKYSVPLGDDVTFVIGPRILPYRHFDVNPYTNVVTGASGLNSYQSTLANSGLSGAGAIISWEISPELIFQAGYLGRNDASLRYFGDDSPANPTRGLFNGSYAALAEFAYTPVSDLTLRFLYVRARNQAPPAGTPTQPNPFFLTNSLRGVVDDGLGGRLNDINSDNFVFNFDWTIASNLALFGRYSYSQFDIDPLNPSVQDGSVELQAFQLGLAFPNVGREGALGAISVVIPFDILAGREFLVSGYGNGGTEVDLEASYFYPISDHVSIVPTFFAIFNANNFSDNPTVFSAVLRTQFLF